MKCKQRDCKRDALYGTHYQKPNHCSVHREEDECNVSHRRCDNCVNLATMGWPHCRATMCFSHTVFGMVKHRKLLCEFFNCDNYAYFANVGAIIPTRCGAHLMKDDVNVVFGTCVICNISVMYWHLHDNKCVRCQYMVSPNVVRSLTTSVSRIDACSLCSLCDCSCVDNDISTCFTDDDIVTRFTDDDISGYFTDDNVSQTSSKKDEPNISPGGRPYTEWMNTAEVTKLVSAGECPGVPVLGDNEYLYNTGRLFVTPGAIDTSGKITKSCWIVPISSIGTFVRD
jgi:hypothetical protein